MFDVTFNRHASRRDFLRVGGLSAFGLTLPGFLKAAQQAPLTSRRKNRAKSVILVYLGGGLSHHDSFDLKPEQPEEIRGVIGIIEYERTCLVDRHSPRLGCRIGRIACM